MATGVTETADSSIEMHTWRAAEAGGSCSVEEALAAAIEDLSTKLALTCRTAVEVEGGIALAGGSDYRIAVYAGLAYPAGTCGAVVGAERTRNAIGCDIKASFAAEAGRY